MPTAELRHYQLKEGGDRQAFVDVFWNGVVPARKQYGFTVEGAWSVNDAEEFVWIVSHPGSVEDFTAAEKAYYAGPERAVLAGRPGLVRGPHGAAAHDPRLTAPAYGSRPGGPGRPRGDGGHRGDARR